MHLGAPGGSIGVCCHCSVREITLIHQNWLTRLPLFITCDRGLQLRIRRDWLPARAPRTLAAEKAGFSEVVTTGKARWILDPRPQAGS